MGDRLIAAISAYKGAPMLIIPRLLSVTPKAARLRLSVFKPSVGAVCQTVVPADVMDITKWSI